MIQYARYFYYIFGLITLFGGIQGFINKGSNASLIAGSITGILLVVAGWLTQSGKATPGVILGLVVSLALVGNFTSVSIKKGFAMWPAGTEIALGLITAGVSIVALMKR